MNGNNCHNYNYYNCYHILWDVKEHKKASGLLLDRLGHGMILMKVDRERQLYH